MTVEEAVRTLGKCIQADPRYQQYQQAKQNNDADTALQEQIGAFNMKMQKPCRLWKKNWMPSIRRFCKIRIWLHFRKPRIKWTA